MRRLTGLDATFLYLETPTTHMHVGGVYVLDPQRRRTAVTHKSIRALINERIHLLKPLRWRLVEVPMGLHHPLWINDPDFDLDAHIHSATLPTPGGQAELEAFVGQVMAQPLDRSRPLWEVQVVDGLAHGRRAVVTKVHHALIDGQSGAELTALLVDLTARPRKVDPPDEPFTPDPVPTEAQMLAFGLKSAAEQPGQLMKLLRNAAESVRGRQHAGDAPGLFRAPHTMLNASITADRVFAYGSLPWDDVSVVRSAFGATVNDVVMATCAGGLRRYLQHHDQLPDEPLVAMVPISTRADDQRATMGNRVGQLLCTLATDLADPVQRLRAIQAGMLSAKAHHGTEPDSLPELTELGVPAVMVPAARLYAGTGLAQRHRPLWNVTVSNVPGFRTPLYLAGGLIKAWYPVGPIFDGLGVNLTVLSYLDHLGVGLLSSPSVLPDAPRLVEFLEDSLAELVEAAGQEGGAPESAR